MDSPASSLWRQARKKAPLPPFRGFIVGQWGQARSTASIPTVEKGTEFPLRKRGPTFLGRVKERGQMIRTTYTDCEELRDKLDKYMRAAPAEEDDLIHVAAVLENFGITITDTREEFEKARAKIPKHLLFRATKLKGYWILLHGRIDGLRA
jgi:hypothetical protein